MTVATPLTIAPLSRRQLLGYGLAAVSLACMPRVLRAATDATRSLSFVHTHTGETLSVAYCCNDVYDPQALAQVNHLLRDFRSGELHPIDPALLDVLHDLQVRADREAVFEIISGYRSPQTNSSLRSHSSGVAKRSLHMEGKAIDIRVTGYSTAKLRDLALGLQRGGVGYYKGSDFVHVDTGRVRAWAG